VGYGITADMLEAWLDVRQLLVEFHHRFPGVGFEKTKTALRQLKQHGYGLFFISKDGHEYSFLRKTNGDG
jgi:phosphoglycolate phosphatase-like HAD superfamily hydrolase